MSGRQAVLVVDVQQGMFGFPEKPHDGEAFLARLRGVIARARSAGVPVIFVKHAGGPGDPLAPGEPGHDIHPMVAPNPGETVMTKSFSSAFQDTSLEAMLRARGVSALTVGGMQSEFCVDSAVRSAFERGFAVTLLSDGHSTFGTRSLTAAQIVAHENATLREFAELRTAESIAFG